MEYKYVSLTIIDRPKHGFSIPIEQWLKKKELRLWADDIDSFYIPCLNIEMVQYMWNEFIEKNVWLNQIWYTLVFYNGIERK